MTTTEVTEISPVFLCLQPYNEQSTAADVSKSEGASSANENEVHNTPHSSPMASSEAGESLANERCSSVLSSSTNGEASSTKRNKPSSRGVPGATSSNSNEHSLRSSTTNNSLHSSLRQSHNKFNKQRYNNGAVNGIILMGSPTANQNTGNESKIILANGNGPDRMSIAVSRMNERGSITSVLSNGGAHPISYSNGVSHRYISC
ncbi:uncharacterized protein LOC142337019 [Convolutriloba macropyga]|uniref:uncharacterized protein LOC142337019 n=1 Tax=Convolutriloba macropyga TaxID=536237 RepID=UPI003F52357E